MTNENKNTGKRLQELGGSGYEIADGQPNIKGWDVKTANGEKVGEVDELIFDKQSQKVRYIVVDLEGNVLDLDSRDVLVPIGLVQLHEKDDDVILTNITAEQLRALPEYEEDKLDTGTESKIRTIFEGSGAALTGTAMASTMDRGDDDNFYNHDHFNEENMYRNRRKNTDENTSIPIIEENLQVGKREVETGGIRLHSKVVEKQVEENINLREEKVRVERVSADRPATEDDLREENIEVTERSEVPVVSKTARVVEEVSLNKDVTEKEEKVSDTVRKTEVDIEELENKNIKDIDRDRT